MAKIAVLSFYSGVVNRGVETFAYEIAKRLSKKHQVFVFQAGLPKLQKYKTVHIQVKTSPPKSQKGFLGKVYLDKQSGRIFVFSIKAIPKIIKGKCDVIIPLNGGWQTVIFRVISKITGAKILISGHAGVGSDDAWNLLFRPDIFVALTAAEAVWAQRLVPEAKIVTIPNGVDLSRFNPKIKAHEINLPGPIAICTSALVPYKRVDQTIKAIAKTNISLLVLGDGEQRGFIDGLGKRMLGKRYLRISAPYEQIPYYYRAGDIFTIASSTEAFGIAYVEAMACNLPVVTTNDASRREIVGRAGILTNTSNINEYAKALNEAVTKKFGNIPYDQALNFSWNKVAQKYSAIVEQLKSK